MTNDEKKKDTDSSENKKVTIEVDERTYNTLIELLNSTKILQDYLNDQVIQDISKHLGSLFKLLNIVSSTDLVDILEKGMQDPIFDKALLKPPRIGIGSMLKAFRDEDFQRGLGLVVGLLSALGRASKSRTII